MTDDAALRDLLFRWQAGWVTARDYRSVRDGDTVTVRIGMPDRVVETIALSAAPDLYAELAKQVAAPSRWLTAPTTDRERTAAAAAAAGFTVHAPEWLMSRPLAAHPVPEPPTGYELLVSGRNPVLVAEVVTANGLTDGLAAKGHLALSGDGEQDAVADRIFTLPDHRRRGLGSVVMGALTATATERGARNGLLVASGDGRQLYERLGWRVEVEMVVAHWSGDVATEPARDPLQ